MHDPDKPFSTTPDNIRKFLTRPYKDIPALLEALKEAAQTRPSGTFLSDPISVTAMGIAAHNVMEAFKKAYEEDQKVDLIAEICSKPYEQVSEVTRQAIVNAFIPVLAAAVKAFADVDLLTTSMDKIAKTLCDAREKHNQEGEPYSEDFLTVAKAITRVMKTCVGNISHPAMIPDSEDDDDCDCPGCIERRQKAKSKCKSKDKDADEGIGMEVEHMKLTLDPKKPETWAKEIQKLAIPEEVKQMILAKVKQEHAQTEQAPKMPPPTGFDVDFRRN